MPALPPHDDEPAVVDNEEEDVILALQDAHSTVIIRTVQQRTQEQLSNQKVKVGFHHGHFNTLLSMWMYPKGLTVIHFQLARLWLMGSKKEHVPALRRLSTTLVAHFDPRGKIRSPMKFVMCEVVYLSWLEGVWHEGRWTSGAVTTMLSTIWRHLEPYLCTLTTTNDRVSDKKAAESRSPGARCTISCAREA